MMKRITGKNAAKRISGRGAGGPSLLRSFWALLLAAAMLASMGAAPAPEGEQPAPTDVISESAPVPEGDGVSETAPAPEGDSVSETGADGGDGGDTANEPTTTGSVQNADTPDDFLILSGPATNALDLTDLQTYLKDATLWKQNADGSWAQVTDGNIVLGNNYRLKVHFEGGTNFQKEMHWSLGKNVKCEPVTGQPVWDGDKKIGTYDLDADGNVTVHFDESYLAGQNQKLDMEFSMVPTKTPGQTGDDYPWSGFVKDDNIVSNTAGLHVEKTADYYSSSSGSISYFVDATVTEGMVTDGWLEDAMMEGLYFRNVVDMKVFDAEGHDVTREYQSYIDALMKQLKEHNNEDGTGTHERNWKIGPLPPMTQGMRFQVQYKSSVEADKQKDKDYTAKNTVTFGGKKPDGTEADPVEDTAEKPLAKDQLSKSGNATVVDENGEQKSVIQWTVRVGSGQWDPFEGTKGTLEMKDTLGKGLTFHKGQPITVKWCAKDGTVRGTYTIDWTNNTVKFSGTDGNIVTYPLDRSQFKNPSYSWADGDYLEVSYYTDYDPEKQPSSGFENTIYNDVLTTGDGAKGKVPVGEAVQKSHVDNENDGYVSYTVTVDVPPASQMSKMSGKSEDDEKGHAGQSYFYIQDRLDFGSDYYVQNLPENLTIEVVGKNSGKVYDFAEVPYTQGQGDGRVRETYQVLYGAESPNTTNTGENKREFRIYFNVARYGLGDDGILEHHDSIWDIDEPTQVTIRYRISYDAKVFESNGTERDVTLGEVLSQGKQLDNKALSRRSSVKIEIEDSFSHTPNDTGIDKFARYQGDGVVEYRVTFINKNGNSRIIKTSNYEGLDPTLIDTFDERMEYVPGSLHVEVYSTSGNTIYASYDYDGDGPVDASHPNMLKARFVDFKTQLTHDKEGHYHPTNGTGVIETLDTGRKYVFVYQLRLKDEFRKTWQANEKIENTANFKYDGKDHTDVADIDIPSDMLQKTLLPKSGNILEYTLNVNTVGADLVNIEKPEGFVNLDSYKLVDEMSANLRLVAKDDDYAITVEYCTNPEAPAASRNWEKLTRSAAATGISPELHNYYQSVDGSTVTFILPDNLPIRITYEVIVDGAVGSNELARNKATLYADDTEEEERVTVYEVGNSSASGSSDPVVRLEKKETGTGNLLAGAVFDLYSDKQPGDMTGVTTMDVVVNGKPVTMYRVGSYTTNDMGKLTVTPVTDGVEALYVLVETQAPTGHVMTAEPIFFRFSNYGTAGAGGTVELGGKQYDIRTTDPGETFAVENPPMKYMQAVKINASAKEDQEDYFLAGAGFTLSRDGGEVYTGVSREPVGVVEWTLEGAEEKLEQLERVPGSYTLSETKAPEGYLQMEDVTFTVDADGTLTLEGEPENVKVTESADGYTISFIISNTSSYVLPESGGMGTMTLYVTGGMLVLAAGLALVCDSRRRRARG